MTLDGYTTGQLEELWQASFDAWGALLKRADQAGDEAMAVPWHGSRWRELAASIEVLLAAGREQRDLCEAIRAEIDRRPVDA